MLRKSFVTCLFWWEYSTSQLWHQLSLWQHTCHLISSLPPVREDVVFVRFFSLCLLVLTLLYWLAMLFKVLKPSRALSSNQSNNVNCSPSAGMTLHCPQLCWLEYWAYWLTTTVSVPIFPEIFYSSQWKVFYLDLSILRIIQHIGESNPMAGT